MGWLRLVGSIKSQVSFAEYSLFYRALLQKKPIISRSLLIIATPYQYEMHPGREVGGWGRDPKKMYGERLGNGVEYHLMSPTPRR